jgi:protein-disulfide isomerase
MRFKSINPTRNLFLILLLMALALSCAGCGSQAGAGAEKPQAGDWTGNFSTKDGDQEKHWVVDFVVSDDGKTVTRVQLAHYYGELNDDTEVTILLSASTPAIENNSFSVTIPEFYDYSAHSYEGRVVFTSNTTADGTFKIDETEYKWTSAPVSK